MAFGKEILRLKEEANIPATLLAAFIGVNYEKFAKWMPNDSTPKKEEENLITRFFGMTIEDVMKLSSIRKYVEYYKEPEAGKKIIKARELKGWSEEDVVKKLVFTLKISYGVIQYKKLEAGYFLKTKSAIVKELDNLLGIAIYEDVYGNKIEEHDTSYSLNDNIFYVPAIMQSEYATRFNDPAFIQQLKKRASLLDILGNSSRSRVFDMRDDSMHPVYKEGSRLLCEKIEIDKLLQVGDYYVYVIVLDTGIVIKRLLPLKDQGKFVAKSDNTYYQQYLIPVEDIKEMWLVKGEIKTSLKKSLPDKFEPTL